MLRLTCKYTFNTFIKGESYEYYTNFGGLNHFVIDNGGVRWSFNGEPGELFTPPDRHYIYDYFWTQEESREIKIDKIIL